ncbi:hypothetical protein BTO06_05685 [Tenacibaculum sp. SZ-18]|uniref:hypothetical protein n=1 Tax=Tenacibaculum sp. SZ-18 TaxID=754423 RepID=UPI000C2CE923|nr:hypothetical protein [Tenacibaculum sp. SZ-18]AUC14662.1 hypothetical protein BTO06_05685 [Tenacibaculum sp. SZ-18]
MKRSILSLLLFSLIGFSCVNTKAKEEKKAVIEIDQKIEEVSKEVEKDLESLEKEAKEIEEELKELDNL